MPVVLPSIDHRNEHTVLARETIRLARCAARRTRRPSYGTMKHILAKFTEGTDEGGRPEEPRTFGGNCLLR